MKSFALALTALCTLAFAGCSSIETSQDYDKHYDFSTLKSYQWLPAENQIAPKAVDFAAKAPLIAERIHKAIEYTLRQKGYQKVDASPDFYVTYHVAVESKIRSRPSSATVGSGYYGRYGGWAMNTGTDIYQYDEGKLLVDVLDKQQQMVWRGISTSIVSEHESPENTTRLINEMISAVFEPFPPELRQ